ncbi:hypothetical protein Ct61P_03979 [Colletotrichum tofieldiae]|nr:hypothetical protein Ct61P_03979 [Colletotrichum tofieldiae]
MAESPSDGYLRTSVDAASLAFMSFHLSRSDLLCLAKQRYGSAIRNTRLALNSLQHHNSDHVIQSVLLLDLYEKMANRDEHHFSSWRSHAQGALHMIEARASTDFSNPNTCQLAVTAAVAIMISCGVARVPVPATLAVVRGNLDKYVRNAKWTFTELVLDVVNLRADMQKTGPGLVNPNVALRRAKTLDQRMASMEERLENYGKRHRTYITANNPLVFGRYYDIYPSHYATQKSNAVRMMRLEMLNIVQNLVKSENQDIHKSLATVVEGLARCICATVPQFLLPQARTENEPILSPLQRLHCCTTLTPLYVSFWSTKDDHMKDWILGVLKHMTDFGICLAGYVSQILKSGEYVDYWTVYATVGSYAIGA